MKHKCDGCKYKGEHQKIGVCYKEHSLIEAAKAYKADKCPFAKPMTNFERIKTKIAKMNLIELFEFFGGATCENVVCSEIPTNKAHCAGRKPHDCEKCIMEFLESEVQTNETENKT